MKHEINSTLEASHVGIIESAEKFNGRQDGSIGEEWFCLDAPAAGTVESGVYEIDGGMARER